MTPEIRALLERIVEDMLFADGWINRCRWCLIAWPDENGHEPDCIYLEAKKLLAPHSVR